MAIASSAAPHAPSSHLVGVGVRVGVRVGVMVRVRVRVGVRVRVRVKAPYRTDPSGRVADEALAHAFGHRVLACSQ